MILFHIMNLNYINLYDSVLYKMIYCVIDTLLFHKILKHIIQL